MKPSFIYSFALVQEEIEILALKWSDIDFENHSISINETVQYIARKGICYGTPKTTASKRIIRISEEVVRMLRAWRTEQAKQKFSCGVLWGCDLNNANMKFCDNHDKCDKETNSYCNKHCKMYSFADRVFTTDSGSQLHLTRHFVKFRKTQISEDLNQ